MGLLELVGWDHSEGPVQPAVVVPVDPAGGGVLDVGEGLVRPAVEDRGGDALGLEQADDALHEAVVVGVADGPDRGGDAFESQMLGEPDRRVLRSGVVMMNQLARAYGVPVPVTVPQGDPQRSEDQVGPLVGGGVPGEDALGEDVDDERDLDETGPGPTVGEVGHPSPIRRRGPELPVEQVRGPVGILGRDGGADPLAAANPVPTQISHEAVHGAKRHLVAGPAQMVGHLATAVQPFRGALGGQDRISEHGV